MRKIISAIALLAISTATINAGESGFDLEVIGAVGGGTLAYEISASGPLGSIKSRLEFPLDGVYAGLQGIYHSDYTSKTLHNLAFGIKILTNLSDPSGDMNDYDWWNGEKIGDTQSDAESDTILLDMFAKAGIWQRDNLSIGGIAGLRYENYQYDIYGVEGVYRPPIGDGYIYETSATRVLTYEMTHTWLYGGIDSALAINSSIDLQGHLLLGIGYISDEDNHLLRSKVSTSDYISFSTEAGAYLIWYLSQPNAPQRFYVKAGGEIYGMLASGSQDQTFGDGTPNNNNIDADIDMLFVSARAMLGCSF